MAARSVLFVCVSNAGKSVMAAGLMRQLADPKIVVTSAGTHAKGEANQQSVETLAEIGVDISDHEPTQLTDQMVGAADLVVIVGTQARLDEYPDTHIVSWETDEPSLRGIDGIERMRIIRDEIAGRVEALAAELNV